MIRVVVGVSLFAALLPQASLVPAAGEPAEPPVLIDSQGVWTLADLGYGDLRYDSLGESNDPVVVFRLPEGSSQGPSVWYVIHLKLFAEFVSADVGYAYFTASTNGRIVAQIKFSGAPGKGISWSTVNLVDGRTEVQEQGPAAAVSFSNYAQLAGIQGGINELSFAFEPAGLDAKRLVVYGDSGIELTSASPPALDLRVWSDAGRVEPGDRFEISYEVTNKGQVWPREVQVGIVYPPDAISATGSPTHRYPSPQGALQGSFELMAEEEGTFRLALGAQSPSNRPVAEMELTVGGPGASEGGGSLTTSVAASVALATAALGSLAVLALRRRRRGGP